VEAPAGPEPVGYSGHGALFTPTGEEIAVTPDFIRRAQAYYLTPLYSTATPRQRAAFDHKSRLVADLTRGDESTSLYAQLLLLDSLIDQLRPADAVRLTHKTRLLKEAWARHVAGVASRAAAGGRRAQDLPASTIAMLRQAGLPVAVPLPAATVAQDREAYIKDCVAAGVPVPGTYEINGSGWKSNGELQAGKSQFVGPGNRSQVVYRANVGKEPEGLCIALPRYNNGSTDLQALGLICMGAGKADAQGAVLKASKACFFDYPKGAGTLDTKIKLLDFKSNGELEGGDVCTDCHAGENAFVVHPDVAAFQGLPNRQPKFWYVPMVDKTTWPRNPEPKVDITDGVKVGSKCNACHFAVADGGDGRLPVLSTALNGADGYCNTILRGAIQNTMPKGSKAWDGKPDGAYDADIKALLKACTKPPPP
jgi:hypothetical protein